jgi:hypothetical protein
MRVAHVAYRAIAIVVLCLGADCGIAQVASTGAPVVRAEFDIGRQPEVIVVPVSIQGRIFRFQVDTGSAYTTVSDKLRSLLGRARDEIEVVTAIGRARRQGYDAPLMLLGTERLARGGVVYLVHDDATAGTLGMDVLDRFVLSLDFDAGTLRILDHADRTLGTEVRFRRFQGVPLMKAMLNREEQEEFIIDTGMAGEETGLLAPALFDRQVEARNLLVVGRTEIGTSSGSRWTPIGPIASIAIAGYKHSKPLFVRSTINALALRYWMRYTVTFDFPKSVMYLMPSKGFARRDSCDQAGIELAKMGQHVVVRSVVPGSPAYNAGLRAGDEVIAIDELDAMRSQLQDLEQHLYAEATDIRMTIRRKGIEYLCVVHTSSFVEAAERYAEEQSSEM